MMASLSSLSSGDSSSPVEEEKLELELGLGLGLPDSCSSKERLRTSRILTAQDLPSLFNLGSVNSSGFGGMVSSSASSSSNSPIMCPTLNRTSACGGVKRPADSVTANNAATSQVVGWPPIRTYRMNSMANQAKPMAAEEYGQIIEKAKINNVGSGSIASGIHVNSDSCQNRPSRFVKVYMDGMLIGRKIDLSAQGSYEVLAQTLENMFFPSNPSTDGKTENNATRRHLKLLNDSSDFMLAYEDKDGDWMLVGDVPWGMFLSSVKRLKIMKTCEATGFES